MNFLCRDYFDLQIDKFRNRTAHKIKCWHFIFWLRDWKIKSNFSIFTVRVCFKKLSNVFVVWAEHVDIELQRMQEIQEGMESLITRRQIRARISAIDFWHLKTFLRGRVKQLAVRNHDLRLQSIKNVAKSLLLFWVHTVKSRNDQLAKLEFLRSELHRKKSAFVICVWADSVGRSKILFRNQRSLENIVRKRRAKSAFIGLDFFSESMQRRRAVFERNAIRSEYQTSRTHFELWVLFREQSKFLASRLQHFIKFRTAQLCSKRAFIIWCDKHSRSVSFDQRLFLKFLATKRQSFSKWQRHLQDQEDFSEHVTLKNVQKLRKLKIEVLRLWKFISYRTKMTSKNSEKILNRYEKNLLNNSMLTWHSRKYHAMNKKSSLKIIKSRLNALVWSTFKQWRVLTLQFKKLSNQLEHLSKRVRKRSVNFVFEFWQSKSSDYQLLKQAQLKIRERGRLNHLSRSIKAWASFLQYLAALARFIAQRRFKQSRFSIAFGFRCLSTIYERAVERSKFIIQLQSKACKFSLSKACRCWFQEVVIVRRNLISAEKKSLQKLQNVLRSRTILLWKAVCCKEKRLILKIECWELKALKNTFENWVVTVSFEVFRKAKIHQHLTIHKARLIGWIFFHWRDYKSFNKKRKSSLQFFCDKSVTRFCGVAFRSFAMVTILERRQQVIVANIQRWINRKKVKDAAQYLILETRKARIRRQLLERGYIKYLSRTVKSCWTSWASKVTTKKQTTAVLAKAGAVLIHMM